MADKLTRTRAESLLDHIRVMLATRAPAERIEAHLSRQHGIEPLTRCSGLAHENELHTDHCLTCAPRWGWTGKRVKVT